MLVDAKTMDNLARMNRAAVFLPMCLLVSGCSLLFESAETDPRAIDGGAIDAAPGQVDAGNAPEVELGPVQTLSLGGPDSRLPTVAWDGQNYRVVWLRELEFGFDVRSGTAGEASPDPITVATSTVSSGEVVGAWTGSALLIGWSAEGPLLRTGLFDTDQAPIGSETDVSSGLSGIPKSPAIAPAGTQTGIAWQQLSPTLGSTIFFARLDGTGALIGQPGDLQEESAISPSLAFDGSAYALVWLGDRESTGVFDVNFRRLSATGVPNSPPQQLSNATVGALDVAIASNGSDFGVVWYELGEDSGAPSSVFFSLVGADLNVLGPVLLSDPQVSSQGPAMVWNGESFGVAWEELRGGQREIRFREFAPSGIPIGETIQISAGITQSRGVSLAHSGDDYGLAWETGATGARAIQFRTLRVTGP